VFLRHAVRSAITAIAELLVSRALRSYNVVKEEYRPITSV